MNKKGQFSIIAALLVAVVLITTVIVTYSVIRDSPDQTGPTILSAIEETNLAMKQILGFTVGYYGSALQVTGNSTYAKTLATNYLQSGLVNAANTHPEWGMSLRVNSSALQTYWFANESYSSGSLTVNYDLAGLGITGINYQTSSKLNVQVVNSMDGQAFLNITADENEPLVTLGKQDFNFYRYKYADSAWEFANPSKDPTAYANGTYSIDIPSGINPYSYVLQVGDRRGIIVVASSFNTYACSFAWNSTSVQTGAPPSQNYVNNCNSSVDSFQDIGTHSNFPAQLNADGVYDNMTETQDPNSSRNYYPSSYSLTNWTSLVSGGITNLTAYDSVYMQYRSWASATVSSNLYSNRTLTTLGSNQYYSLSRGSAAQTQLNVPASIASTGRVLFAKTIYQLTGVNTINASTLTFKYSAYQDANQSVTHVASASKAQTSAQNYISWTQNLTSGNNRLLIVVVTAYNDSSGSTPTCSGVTYNGMAMTQQVTASYLVAGSNSNLTSYLFTMVAPPTGSAYTIRANWSTACVSIGGSSYYTGVDQATPIPTTASATDGAGLSSNVSISVASGYPNGATRAVFAACSTYNCSQTYNVTDDSGQNSRWTKTGQPYKARGSDKRTISASGGTVWLNWTETCAVNWVDLAVVINSAGGAAFGNNCSVDIVIRKSDDSVRSTIATFVANSTANITATRTTLQGTYAMSNYSVVDPTDYFEVDYYVYVNNACAGMNAYLEIDNSNRAVAQQTGVTNIFLPSQFTAEVVLEGLSDGNTWGNLNWTVNSKCSVSGVTVKTSLYNFTSNAYQTSGDGYSQTTVGTSDVAQTQLITSVPNCFKNNTYYYRYRLNAQLATTSQFDFYIDYVSFNPTVTNYVLSMEEQWINANYTNAMLCIKTGSLAAEALAVDAWNGSAWISVLASLNASSWNNATISSYLQPSTFTIKLKSTNETYPDTVQDSWQIDAALLTVWPTVDLYSLSRQGTISVELLQNGTMRWNGQNLILTDSTSIPFPPVPVRTIHVNQTINGMNNEVPFQVEDWSSSYRIPLGLTSNASIFSSRTMLVFLATPNASKTTIWWNGSDTASQTSYAYTNRYFNDSPGSGRLSNGITTLQFQSSFIVTSTVGSSSSTANFMRINNTASSYGSKLAYVIANGTVRDIIHQEPEWSNGAPNCSDIYADVVLTLPANTTYYTYQLRLMFVESQQNRTINDLCPIWLTSLTGQLQTENGTASGLPIVSNATDLFCNYSASSWAHHWSQSISGTKGAGIMFTDSANQNLYIFDSIAGVKTGSLLANSTAGTIQLLPIAKYQLNFSTTLDSRMQDIIWYGAVATFDTTTPIYSNSDQTGLWIIVEYPPTVTVTTENYQQP